MGPALIVPCAGRPGVEVIDPAHLCLMKRGLANVDKRHEIR